MVAAKPVTNSRHVATEVALVQQVGFRVVVLVPTRILLVTTAAAVTRSAPKDSFVRVDAALSPAQKVHLTFVLEAASILRVNDFIVERVATNATQDNNVSMANVCVDREQHFATVNVWMLIPIRCIAVPAIESVAKGCFVPPVVV